MMNSGKMPMVRSLRGGRRARFKDVRAKAAELAADLRGILLKNPGYQDAEIDLQALSLTLHRLATRDAELPRSDPLRLLTAAQLGQDLQGLSDDMVRLREKDGVLFSVLPAGRLGGASTRHFKLGMASSASRWHMSWGSFGGWRAISTWPFSGVRTPTCKC